MVEPKYPGVVEQYVNMGNCYDRGELSGLREEIISCMAGYKGCYQRAYRCLGAAAEIFEDARTTLLTQPLAEKLARRAQGILAREVPRNRSAVPGQVKQRFLGAVTHRGPMCLFDTASAQCERIYTLADSYGLSHELLVRLLTGITAEGYDVVACPDPMAPDRLAHLLVPQLSLAFLTVTAAQPFPGTSSRRIRLDTAADGDLLRRSRARLRFTRKVSAALVEEAVDSLAQAKSMHDDLEALYNPHVDFALVDQIAQRVGDEILSLL